jgi:hypothetical protein
MARTTARSRPGSEYNRLVRAIAIALLVPAVASADPWHFTPTATVGVTHVRYAETDPMSSAILDEHLGFVPTVRIALDAIPPSEHWFARASLRWTSSSIEYYGAVENFDTGTFMPFQGPSDGSMLDVDLVGGWRGRLSENATLGGFLGVGEHSWERDLRPLGPAGYLEDYSWSYLQAGAQLDMVAGPQLALSLRAAVLVPHTGNLGVSHQQNGLDDQNIGIGPGLGGRVRIEGDYALSDTISVTAALSYDIDSITSSDAVALTMGGQPVTNLAGQQLFASEPPSTMHRETLEVGAAYRF